MFVVSPPQNPILPCFLSNTDIYTPQTSFRLCFRLDPLLVLELRLASVAGLFVMVDTVESNSVACTRFSDNREALGKSPILEAEEGLFGGLKGLSLAWHRAMGLWEGLDSFCNSDSNLRGYRRRRRRRGKFFHFEELNANYRMITDYRTITTTPCEAPEIAVRMAV